METAQVFTKRKMDEQLMAFSNKEKLLSNKGTDTYNYMDESQNIILSEGRMHYTRVCV